MHKYFVVLLLSILPFSSHAINIITGQQSLEFHGYFRGGLGMSKSGTTQAKFKAPEARAAYRLGNEPDTNLQLQLNYTYDLNDPESKGSSVQGIFMIDGYKNHGESSDFTVGNLAQAYLNFNKFYNSDANIWLGRRYYERKFVHIMDHSWLNPGQGTHMGVGIEDVSTTAGKINLALFRYEDTFTSGGSQLINSTGLDFRLHDVSISSTAKLTLWADITQRHNLSALNYGNKTGFGIGGWIDHKSAGIENTSVLLYQKGPTIKQGDFNGRPIRENLGWNLDKANVLELSNTLTYEVLPDYSLQWALLYRKEDRGTAGNSNITWISTGVRPIFYISKHTNIALEAGIDYLDDKVNNRKGHLSKFTTAYQISADRGLYSRPVLRFFVTLADWSNEFKGLIGNSPGSAPYANDTQGWSIGAQAEVWW